MMSVFIILVWFLCLHYIASGLLSLISMLADSGELFTLVISLDEIRDGDGWVKQETIQTHHWARYSSVSVRTLSAWCPQILPSFSSLCDVTMIVTHLYSLVTITVVEFLRVQGDIIRGCEAMREAAQCQSEAWRSLQCWYPSDLDICPGDTRMLAHHHLYES